MANPTDLFPSLRGFLIDLDGVTYTGDRLIDGAADAIRHLRRKGVPFRFTTNTTTKSLTSLCAKLESMGLEVGPTDVVSAPQAAILHLKKLGRPRCHLILNDDARSEFAEFDASDTEADVVIIGDIGDRWSYAIMDRAFKLVQRGAAILALHKGRYWERDEGLGLDIGAFVAGLEYATGKSAVVVGKPSRAFFDLARESLGLPAHEVAMIGDDVDSDVGGAQRAGLAGVLVRTGKYRDALVAESPVRPDAILDSLADLVGLV